MGEDVYILSDDEIQMLKHKHGVVLFYMDECGHCVNMKPAWNKVINELKESMKNEIILGAAEKRHIEKFNKYGINPKVNGFPTILYFNPSKINTPEAYNGDRSYEDFKKWIMNKNNKGKIGKTQHNAVNTLMKKYDKHRVGVGIQGGGSRKNRRSRRSRRRILKLRKTRKHHKTLRKNRRTIRSGSCTTCGRLW